MVRMKEPAAVMSEPEAPAVPSSFEGFFEAEHVRLLRALYLVTGNEQEAEELSQEAFLKVWERWDRVVGMEDPTGYLYRTAMNLFRSKARAATRAARRLIGRGPDTDEFSAAEERDAVVRALARLTPRQRAALVLTELLGYSSEEAAEILGIKAVTVRVLGSQGRAAMRELLECDDE